MQKIYLFLTAIVILLTSANTQAQSVLNPNDNIVTYNSSTPPAEPSYGQIGKWVRTKRLNWNTDSYKAYIYKGVAFRLKFPKTYAPNTNDGKKYPMLIFFHGLGETGTIYDNEYQLYHGGEAFNTAVDNGTFDGYVLCMQSQGFWGSGQYQFISEIIDYMVTNNKLDPFRISDNGLSAGAQGTWEMLMNYPTYIAAAVPMSGVSIGYKDASIVNKLKFTSIWLVQGGLDGSPAPSTAQQVRDAFLNAGGNFKYTEYSDLGHGTWNRTWSEPDFFPFLLRTYAANPWVLKGRTEFCPGDAINVTLGVAPGFTSYEWRLNGVTISNAASNTLVVSDTGTYDVRVKRGNFLSDWSHTPVQIKVKQATISPDITVQGLMSIAIPAPDGNNFVNLKVPDNYISYTWKKVGSDSIYGNTSVLKVTQPGNYKVSVNELYGCSSIYSNAFTVVNAAGANAPSPASSLTATTLSNTQIELDWANNAKPIYNETAFEIYRSTKSGSNYKLVGQAPADTLSFIDQNLIPNTKYFYIVRAINLNGAATVSNETSAITESDKIAPSAPQNLYAASTTKTSAKLIWNAATDNAGIDKYDVYINNVKSYATADTSVLINGLDSGKLYTFYVKAKDFSGNYSSQSNIASAAAVTQGLQYKYYEGTWNKLPNFNTLTPVKTGTSNNIDISVRNREDGFAFLWQGYIKIPVAGTYKFETNSDDGSSIWWGNYNFSATPLVNNDSLHGLKYVAGTLTLQPGLYPISIAYFDKTGNNVMQVYWTCNALFGDNTRRLIADNYFKDTYIPAGVAPSAPSNLSAQVLSFEKIKLNWADNSTDETSFEVYRSRSNLGPFQIIASVPANTTSYTDSGLSASATYYYRVNAVNVYGSSAAGVKYSYYEGTWNTLPDFASLTPVKTGKLGNILLWPANSTTGYAFKYESYINIPSSGTYTFYTRSDDGSRLYIDSFTTSKLVVNNDHLQSTVEKSGNVYLTQGAHPIYVTFFQKDGSSVLTTSYKSSSIAKQVIPDSAFVSATIAVTTPALPAAPKMATTVKATINSSSSITLTWKDAATNEIAYAIKRSVNDSLHFKQVATLNANSQDFTDSSLLPHTFYYYKISAIGAGNTYTDTKAVRGKTNDNPPVITEIESRSVRWGISTPILITASDVDGDSLTYTIRNKPGIATLVNNGNSTATLTFTPKANTAGVYSTIQLIVYDGNNGSDTTAPFTITASGNYDPTFDSIPDYTLYENDSVSINLAGQDLNTTDSLTWAVSGAPNNFSLTTINANSAKLVLRPDYAAAGIYTVTVKASDGNGGFATRTFKVTVNDKDPNYSIYTRFKDVDDIGSPWNNITSVTTNNLKDANGNSTSVGLQLQTNWFATSNGGPTTGNNSGVYPDAVLKDYYYFGIFGGPETVTAQVTGLNSVLKYNLTFLAASSWPGSSDNGTTTFTIGSQTQSAYVQGNTQNTTTFNGLIPDANGTITFTMAKANANTPVGYINALVISTYLDDGTAPLSPASLDAADNVNGVQLSWQDKAYNETNFQVYRSLSQSTGYALIATTGENVTGYLDTSSHGNTQYYYKVLALNSYGISAYSNIAGVLTSNKIPQVGSISDIVVKNNSQTTIAVTAKDDAGDHVTLTASGLPSFVTFTDNGDGTGSFLIAPSSGTTGYYPGISLTATDSSGLSTSTSFSITVTDQNASSVYLNFSDGTLAGKPWNNLTGWPFANTTFSNLKNESNNASPITVTLVDGFQGVVASGMRPGNSKGIYPEVVMRTAEYEGSTSARTIRISGLSTSKKYNFIFFGSHDDGLNGTTNFTINGQTVTLNATYNYNKTVQINNITPNASGQVNISVAKAAGADYAYISSLIIKEYSNAELLINPTSLTVTSNKRNSVSLSWIDQSSDETGFQVWRADSSSGSYNLINTVGANVTSFTDAGLVQNKTYYYMVRAVNGGNSSGFSNVAVAYTLAYAVYINFTVDSIAGSPWNNTIALPQAGYVWNNFVDEANYQSGITMTELNEFAGLYGDGNVTGKNSGIYPDAVISQSYGLFPGQSAYIKLSGLNLNMNYDLTFFASSRAYGDVNVGYTVNGKTVLLNASLNQTGNVTLYGLVPDENGELLITIAPGTPTSQFGLIGALVVQSYSKPELTLPSQPALLTNASAIAITSSSSVQQITSQQKLRISKDINAYPNPFSSNFVLSFNLEEQDDAQVGIYDLNGRMVYQRKFDNLVKGNNLLKVAPNAVLTSGVYVVKITFLKEKNSKVIKILKL